jgi:hypothetical protein
MLYPVRTTYAYRMEPRTILEPGASGQAHPPLPKRQPEEGTAPDPARQSAQEKRLRDLPVNQWVHLSGPGRVPPDRTWGSATFDTSRGRILYWGGEHCGYEGNDVDAYDLDLHTWVNPTAAPEYPERTWDRGYSRDQSMGITGVTFQGNPWNVHARKIYAYDPVSRKMIVVRPIRLTTSYNPGPLAKFPGRPKAHFDALADPPGSYDKWATWSYDPDTGRWDLLGPAPGSLDTLATTPRGVIGVNVDWPSRLNDSGYNIPWDPSRPPQDRSVYRFDAAARAWTRLGGPQPAPQNLYEPTSLAYDSKRDQLILHGGGARRDELWTFDLKTGRWRKIDPAITGGGAPPVAARESVYIPGDDTLLISRAAPAGSSEPEMWAYRPGENAWHRQPIPAREGIEPARWSGQNRAMVYDPKRGLVLLVLGTGGAAGRAFVWALRYRFQP